MWKTREILNPFMYQESAGRANFHKDWCSLALHDFVILSAAVFQAERRACPELAEGISRLTSLLRKPNPATAPKTDWNL
jgi:hypothetical protein